MSEKKYFKQTKPFRVPTTDGKLIEEHFGNASTHTNTFSVAHMVAPPHWGEPHQTPEFDEITIVTKGKKEIEIDGEKVEVNAGESILIKAGARIRYTNPYDHETEYWSICIPAFDFNAVHREES
ncbi:mannose-6-phosphate isomerase-like protein (cupin superfamily) [Pontibacter mucosus]|uniref:Mannose-6-phosphate isomerase-like protein (Cupin superfamily) n=1 Tax=Pontibacter mucosus TaxID=1649266 RepID=A0A2T5YFA4_9BACT|nr:cupin domain-containing protein [Pontibacter mucosus]PTX18000.1 mannose-6-phosphate isomerase-like protein (cupin superfamily) [Pontibacter mucosus]